MNTLKKRLISITVAVLAVSPAWSASDAWPSELLTTLMPCPPNANCTHNIFQKVWLKIEANSGEITKLDTSSIRHYNNGGAEIAAYTYAPGTNFDPRRLTLLFFDCKGQFQDMTYGSFQVFDAPPRTVVGQIAKVACDGAKDIRSRPPTTVETAASEALMVKQFCERWSQESCNVVIKDIKSKTRPDYCNPGMGLDSRFTQEQREICSVTLNYEKK